MIVAFGSRVAPSVKFLRLLTLFLATWVALASPALAQRKQIEDNTAAIDRNTAMVARLQNEAALLENRVADLENLLAEERAKVAALQTKTMDGSGEEAVVEMAAEEMDKFQAEVDRLRAQIAVLNQQITQAATAQEAELEGMTEQISKSMEEMERFRAAAEQRIGDLSSVSDLMNNSAQDNQNNLNRFWVLIAAFLVFFMQAGFKALEAGMVRQVHADSVAVKNILDWLIVCVVYFAIGFGLMFGRSEGGWVGLSLFLPEVSDFKAISESSGHGLGFEFFLFQLAFAGTAATIVSGAIAERTILSTYLILAVLTTLAYSILGHWTWGNLYLESNPGFLADLGFHDFAGSTVVHSLGAWVALAAVIVIRPRTGRYADDGTIQYDRFKPNSLHYSAMGVFILWFGWFGFNGGSVLAFTEDVAVIIFNTSICAATAGLSAFFFAWVAAGSRHNVYPKMIGGVLGGLVAITACCDVVSSTQAIMLGVLAGIVHNLAFDLMLRCRWDDVVGAVPVHGACGALGTLWVAVGEDSTREMVHQLGIQAVGVMTIFVCTFFPFLIICVILNKLVGLRIGFIQERNGYVVGARRDSGDEYLQ